MSETVTIERMSYGPDAIAHLENGKVAFVAGGVPGDVATVRVIEDKPRRALCVLEEIREPSPLRVRGFRADALIDPLCPWSSLSYQAQLDAKSACVRSALGRTGGIASERLNDLMKPIIPSKREWGYRNKLEMGAFTDAAGAFTLGFHPAGSDEVVEQKTCALGNRLIERAPKALTGALRYLFSSEAREIPVYRVGIRGSIATGEVEVALWTPPCAFPRSFASKLLKDAVRATSVVRVIADAGKARRIKKLEVLDGKGHWDEVMGDDFEYRVSAPSFFQVNTAQAANLVKLVREGLRDCLHSSDALIADLYCGVGTFSIPLAAAGADVIAVELEGSSSRDLRKNCEMADVDMDIICDDVARVLPDLGRVDAIVVDPPRAGLDKEALVGIVEARPDRVAYVSCDPQTLARDVARFGSRGYELISATPVDMFPQTYHVETVAVLRRC